LPLILDGANPGAQDTREHQSEERRVGKTSGADKTAAKGGGSAKQSARDDRQDRLSKALRDNLAKRKQQSRGRGGPEPTGGAKQKP